MERFKCECGNDKFECNIKSQNIYPKQIITCTKCGKKYGLPYIVNIDMYDKEGD